MDRKSKSTIKRLLRTLLELSAHTIALLVVLGLIRLIQWAIESYWGSQDVKFFDRIPLRYIVDGADLMTLMGFLSVGVYNAIQAYRGRD